MENITIGEMPDNFINKRKRSRRKLRNKNDYCVAVNNKKDPRSGDRRKSGLISEDTLDYFISHVRAEQVELVQHLKEKEDKKLVLIKYIFSVLPVFATVATVAFSYMIVIFKEKLLIDPAFIVMMFNMLVVILLGGISTISIALIKYLSSLKTDSIIAMRQINCNRYALYSALFAKVEGRYPSYDELLVNSNDRYNMMHGSHRKFPIDNMDFRSSYTAPCNFWFFTALKWVLKLGNFLYIPRPLIKRLPMSEMILKDKIPRVFHLSSDFFSMLSIAFLTLLLMPLPLMGNILLGNLSLWKGNSDDFTIGQWVSLSHSDISWLIGGGLTLLALYIYMGFLISTFRNSYNIISTALASDKEF